MCESLACISEGTILGLKAKLANLKFKTTKQGTHQSKIQKKSKQNISPENFKTSKDILNWISGYSKASRLDKNLEYDSYFKQHSTPSHLHIFPLLKSLTCILLISSSSSFHKSQPSLEVSSLPPRPYPSFKAKWKLQYPHLNCPELPIL